MDVYNAKYKNANREHFTMKRILKISKLINNTCVKVGCLFLQVIRAKPTGVLPQDMMEMATALFNGMDTKTEKNNYRTTLKYEPA